MKASRALGLLLWSCAAWAVPAPAPRALGVAVCHGEDLVLAATFDLQRFELRAGSGSACTVVTSGAPRGTWSPFTARVAVRGERRELVVGQCLRDAPPAFATDLPFRRARETVKEVPFWLDLHRDTAEQASVTKVTTLHPSGFSVVERGEVVSLRRADGQWLQGAVTTPGNAGWWVPLPPATLRKGVELLSVRREVDVVRVQAVDSGGGVRVVEAAWR